MNGFALAFKAMGRRGRINRGRGKRGGWTGEEGGRHLTMTLRLGAD